MRASGRFEGIKSNFFIILFFSSSLPLFTTLIHINPSGAPPGTCFPDFRSFILFCITGFSLTFMIFGTLYEIKRLSVFRVALPVSGFFLFSGSILLGILLHRDFFSLFFPMVFILCTVLISRSDLYRRRSFLQAILYFSLSMAIILSLWLLMMGYAIATRSEPRWAEAIGYNIYFTILIALFYAHVFRLKEQMFHHLLVQNDKIKIDDYDISVLMSNDDLIILKEFIRSSPNGVRCVDLQKILKREFEDCFTCTGFDTKASQCKGYKTLYNRILSIKKILETFEIGTFISPDNKREILSEGWKLRLFDDVKVIHR